MLCKKNLEALNYLKLIIWIDACIYANLKLMSFEFKKYIYTRD